MTRRCRLALILAAAAATVVGGCAAGARQPSARPSRQPPTPPAAAESASSRPVGVEPGPGGTPTAEALPDGGALAVADRFVHAWARPDLDRGRWLAEIRPYTDPRYATALASVDPANVPARTITGAPRLVSSTPAAARVDVPTDAGTVQVTCTQREGRWLVVDIEPPPETR